MDSSNVISKIRREGISSSSLYLLLLHLFMLSMRLNSDLLSIKLPFTVVRDTQ